MRAPLEWKLNMTKKKASRKTRNRGPNWDEKLNQSVPYLANTLISYWKGLTITAVHQYMDSTIIVLAHYDLSGIQCPSCKCSDIVSHEPDKRCIINIPPIDGYAAVLWCMRDRLKCKTCEVTFTPKLPDIVKHHKITTSVRDFIFRLYRNNTFAEIGRLLGLSPSTVKKSWQAAQENSI
jgi:transposase